jgi:SpoVK/Ycf46/Vps4 family AAA+-type ATPase
MSIFDEIIELPSGEVKLKAASLIGFKSKFDRIYTNLKLMLDQEGLVKWSQKFHQTELPALRHLGDKYPLIILAGDAGTGKTASAIAIADAMLRDLNKDGFFLKLSTRVRGEGLHGEMGQLVNDAFKELKEQAGKKRIAFLLIDEADAIATTRSTSQMHQEEKAAVNTLIQKIDEIRDLKGRAVVFMSTNRLHFIDEAIVRRAAVILEFERPDTDERQLLFEQDLEGLELSDDQFIELARLTGPEVNDGLAFSFSDLRLKVIPEAIARCYPSKALNYNDLVDTIKLIKPSPQII